MMHGDRDDDSDEDDAPRSSGLGLGIGSSMGYHRSRGPAQPTESKREGDPKHSPSRSPSIADLQRLVHSLGTRPSAPVRSPLADWVEDLQRLGRSTGARGSDEALGLGETALRKRTRVHRRDAETEEEVESKEEKGDSKEEKVARTPEQSAETAEQMQELLEDEEGLRPKRPYKRRELALGKRPQPKNKAGKADADDLQRTVVSHKCCKQMCGQQFESKLDEVLRLRNELHIQRRGVAKRTFLWQQLSHQPRRVPSTEGSNAGSSADGKRDSEAGARRESYQKQLIKATFLGMPVCETMLRQLWGVSNRLIASARQENPVHYAPHVSMGFRAHRPTSLTYSYALIGKSTSAGAGKR